MAAERLYEVRGAARFFRRGPATVRALDGVDLDIGAGELVALVGPSGSSTASRSASISPPGSRVTVARDVP